MRRSRPIGEGVEVLLQLLSAGGDSMGSISDSASRSVAEEAIRHGVAPLLHGCLSDSGERILSDEAASQLRDVYFHSTLRAAGLPRQLGEVAGLARESGTRVLALKGAHLSQVVYSDPGYRPMQDLDLLLPEAGLSGFRDALLSHGYQEVGNGLDYVSMHHHRPLGKAGAFPIELHRRLSRYEEGMAVDLHGIWDRARPLAGFEESLLVMSPEDLLLHICTHVSYDNRFQVGLLSLCDVDRLIRSEGGDMAWSSAISIANSDGRAPFVYVALRVTELALGTPLPDDLAGMDHGSEEDRLVETALAHVISPPGDAPVGIQRLEGISGPFNKGGRLASAIFPPPDRMRRIYSLRQGSPWVLAYYLVRPVDLLFRWGGRILGMILGVGPGRLMREREERRRLFNRWTGRPKAP